MVSSGHGLASLAGLEILKRGGNAFDAGVAAAMCLSILQPDYAGFVGVSPFIGYSAREKKVLCYSGVGVAPKNATIETFRSRGHTVVPTSSILGQLLPASVDTWIAILRRSGTLRFSDVAEPARNLAFHGFPAHRFMIHVITQNVEKIRKFPYNASIFFQTGGIPKLGELFVQQDAAKTIDIMMAAERRAIDSGKDRDTALLTARDVFYKGEIARAIESLHKREDGLITYDDLAAYKGKWEEPLSTTYGDYTVYTPSTWTQGPLLLQHLNCIEDDKLSAMEHNSTAYINLLAGVIDLGMADREKYYGDPDAVSVSENLWSKRYARARRGIIVPDIGLEEIPPYGDPESNQAVGGSHNEMVEKYKNHPGSSQTDTTYLAVADASGNLFSLTPSDGGCGSPMVPGYGVILGQRMTQFRLTPGHPAALAPGKRPTITPAPAVVMKNGKPYMAFGTPGADMQTQSMLQVFLNLTAFDMNVQEAVESPRFGSYNFPAWFSPHAYYPGRLCVEDRIDVVSKDGLRRLGREVVSWEEWTSLASAVCAVVFDEETGTIQAGADPRRESYAVGW